VKLIDAWTSRYLTTHFHAVSNAAKLAAVNSLGLPSQRITVVERGRDPDRLGQPSAKRRQQARLKLNLQTTDEVIVNVGRHEYQKGQIFLLEAVAKLAHTRSRLVLLIAGRSGQVTSELTHLRDQTGLNGKVHFLGHRDDVPDILAAADLFVFPSLFEGLPGAVIEAMALGLPIVATNIRPVQEVVEENHNALLVKPTSSSELAIAIETLLEDRERATTFGERSREIFETRFTLAQSVSRMIELYHEVVEQYASSD
jgi:glycosyltransferase involved in cell wall biosynthesis